MMSDAIRGRRFEDLATRQQVLNGELLVEMDGLTTALAARDEECARLRTTIADLLHHNYQCAGAEAARDVEIARLTAALAASEARVAALEGVVVFATAMGWSDEDVFWCCHLCGGATEVVPKWDKAESRLTLKHATECFLSPPAAPGTGDQGTFRTDDLPELEPTIRPEHYPTRGTGDQGKEVHQCSNCFDPEMEPIDSRAMMVARAAARREAAADAAPTR